LETNAENKGLRPNAKIKEPRDLFLLPKELDCPLQAARWPTECQVSYRSNRKYKWHLLAFIYVGI